MGLLAKLSGQQQDLIKWDSHGSDALLFRVNNNKQLIKKGALLHVAENQLAVLSSKSVPADVFQAGTHSLDAETLPRLLRIQSLAGNYAGPFIADIIYFNLPAFGNIHWSSFHPVEYADPDYGDIHIRIRGKAEFSLSDPALLLKPLYKNRKDGALQNVREYLSDIIISVLCGILCEDKTSMSEMATRLSALEEKAQRLLKKTFSESGLNLHKIHIGHIAAPDALHKISIDRENESKPGAEGREVPPPMPGELLFYTAENGEQRGPFNTGEFAERFRAGKIHRETYVWTGGMENWQKAADVDVLRAVMDIPAGKS